MKHTTASTPRRLLLALLALTLAALACDFGRFNPAGVGRTQPDYETRELFPGALYMRVVRQTPRPLVFHVVILDLMSGIRNMVTEGNPDTQRVAAQTTSSFLQQNNLMLAINGDGFSPWFDLGPFGSEPDVGDRVNPLGFAVSRSVTYSEPAKGHPILYLYEDGSADINVLENKLHNAISGFDLLVSVQEPVAGLRTSSPEPRTAVGLNQYGTQMVIIVVDGRMPGYSEGVTERELADLMLEQNVFTAMNMDGGGSSTLVVRGADGQPEILNTPIHNGVPGRERPVANHLGFYFP